MFPGIDDVTKEMLNESGELQRSYLVVRAFNDAYDAYVEKHKDRYVEPIDLHEAAQRNACLVINLVFGNNS